MSIAAGVAVAVVGLLLLIEPSPSHTQARTDRDAAAAPLHVPRPRSIVMFVFDELPLTSLMGPGGRIDAERYPAFARLAHGSNWYRGATAVHDSTALAVPAMLDGRYPRPGLRSDVYSHPANLFTLLAKRYEVHASEEATGLCPTSLCEPLPGTTLTHLARGKVERFREFVAEIDRRPRRALWFKHVLLPHVPWQFYPSGVKYRRNAPEPIPGVNGRLGFGDPWLVKVSYQRHLLQLGLADKLLGELLARVRELDLYRDALIVVVADHGIGFHLDEDRRTVTPDNPEDLAPVPLIVKLPRQRSGRVVDAHVETIDVLPTILEVAGVSPPPALDGRSVLRPAASQAARATVYHRVGGRLNTVGGDYSFDVEELEQRRQAAVRRKLGLFGSGGGREPDRLYRIGPHPEIVGRATATLPRVPGRATARIDQAEELRRVDPASGFVPGEITGNIPHGRRGGGRAIALALDGRVVATGRTFSLAGARAESFEFMVPSRAFHRGATRALVFELTEREDEPALRPL